MRVMVVGPDGLKYVLQKKGWINNKMLYIPITVLLPHMSFN